MTHFLFLSVFAAAVGIVLGAMMRRDPREAAKLGLWIALGMIGVALGISWVLYLLPV